MGEIRIGIVGVGNCASSLIQGISYYSKKKDEVIGLMHYEICGYTPKNIKVVAAFDVDRRKVGRPVEEAIFANPNCTKTIEKDVPASDVLVSMGRVLDGISPHMKNYPENRTFVLSDKEPEDVISVLKEKNVEILVNYLPVGSEEASRFYANCCLESGVSLINCIPVFIASDKEWIKRFEEKNIPIVGDDVKSQIGATIIHRSLVKLFDDRGVKIDRTYQLNTGGNTDFLNMLNRDRLVSKKISKTEAVQSSLNMPMLSEDIHIGPSDYVPWQNDNKVCFIRIEGRIFGDVPINLELRLSVEDSPNSAGCMIDAIRCCKVARDREIGGVLESISAYTMKHPFNQFPDNEAREMVEAFIRGERER
ncbi:MAG: Inositol-3-phosphate synthase [Syntrophorhabdaceae bacterium]|jgi:myo-inositol-1-phosphate synthase|nr:Inositol-3-phosphate synthase [Syntrophorhabdaceae bacterium]HOG39924.1 inositol-3-phosphate synthase [Syntrophorhabdaceae bacterium]HQP51040.1 inositol-3-phosphate synthase [Syntrophorhabdaceae bacterium]